MQFGTAKINNSVRPLYGATLDYRFESGLIGGVQWGLISEVPLLTRATYDGRDTLLSTGAESGVVLLLARFGYEVRLHPFDLSLGVSGGGVNVANRRHSYWPSFINEIRFAQSSWTETEAGFAAGVWSRVNLKINNVFHIGLTGGYTWLDASRFLVRDEDADIDYTADFASDFPWFGVNVGASLGKPAADTARERSSGGYYSGYALLSVASSHPFSDNDYNQFNPGIGYQHRFILEDSMFWTLLEGGVYQYSEGDAAAYAGFGLMLRVAKSFVSVGGIAGFLTLLHPEGNVYTVMASPRITFDSNIGSVSVVFIPAMSESAFGLQLSLPLY